MIGPYHACMSCGAPAMTGDRLCPCGGRIGIDRLRQTVSGLASERRRFRREIREAKASRFPLARRWWLEQAARTARRFRVLAALCGEPPS